MKKVVGLAVLGLFFFLGSCDKCAECHYENANDEEVELGEKCGDDLEEAEENGITVSGTNYEIHCHDH